MDPTAPTLDVSWNLVGDGTTEWEATITVSADSVVSVLVVDCEHTGNLWKCNRLASDPNEEGYEEAWKSVVYCAMAEESSDESSDGWGDCEGSGHEERKHCSSLQVGPSDSKTLQVKDLCPGRTYALYAVAQACTPDRDEDCAEGHDAYEGTSRMKFDSFSTALPQPPSPPPPPPVQPPPSEPTPPPPVYDTETGPRCV